MRTLGRTPLITTALAVVGLAFFHIARPMAVSAQAQGTARAQATVVPADAAWAAHRMTTELARSALAEDEARSRSGTSMPSAGAPREHEGAGLSVGSSREDAGTFAWLDRRPGEVRGVTRPLSTPVGSEAPSRVITVVHLAN